MRSRCNLIPNTVLVVRLNLCFGYKYHSQTPLFILIWNLYDVYVLFGNKLHHQRIFCPQGARIMIVEAAQILILEVVKSCLPQELRNFMAFSICHVILE